jgi:glycosyltransferase involved in cell wall biosynthesis
LRKIAGPTIEFCGHISDGELRELYATCRALVIPAEEDFGMTAVEALASGKPVIALARGGVLESVPTRDPVAGVFYAMDTDEGLAAAVAKYEALEPRFRYRELQSYAARFSTAVFEQRMAEVLGIDVPETSRGHAYAPVWPRSHP